MVEKSCYNLLLLNLKCNIIEYVQEFKIIKNKQKDGEYEKV